MRYAPFALAVLLLAGNLAASVLAGGHVASPEASLAAAWGDWTPHPPCRLHRPGVCPP